MPTRAASRWMLWLLVSAAVTVLLLSVRIRLDKAHVALVYLLLVLAASVSGGRRLGLTLAGAAFVLFNWFFLLPYNTLAIRDPLDWLVLVVFLAVSTVAAELVHRLRTEADAARERSAEVDRFAVLGAEALNVGRAEEAIVAVADVIRATLRLADCRIHAVPASQPLGHPGVDPLATWVAEHGRAAARLADGTTRVAQSADPRRVPFENARVVLLPLQVRDRTVGVLELTSDTELALDAAQRRFLRALAYYAALAIERARLEAEAGHAEALREADALKNALLASVSHDLRTPLTTIKAVAHDLASLDDRALIIEEEADRLNRLVADLLDFSRIQGNALPVRLEVNAVDDVVGAAMQRVAGPVENRELQVRLEDGPDLLLGRFDFVHTLRILVNLLENAVKYAPSNQPIELTAARQGDWIELAVLDRGPGVAEADRERIFDAFYRPAGAPTHIQGTGLGLAIGRRLALAQGGQLRYQPRPGGGSAFTVSLPAADPPPDDSADSGGILAKS